MVFRNFRLNVTLRVIVLSLSIALEAWLLTSTYILSYRRARCELSLSPRLSSIIRFVEKANEVVTRFFRSVKEGDFLSASSTSWTREIVRGTSRRVR